MKYQKGDVVRILDDEGHYLNTKATGVVESISGGSSVFVSGVHRLDGRYIEQILRLDQVEPIDATVAVPVVIPVAKLAAPVVEVSEEVEIAQRLGDIYGVWSGGRLYSVEDTREDARVVKSDLGGKARGAFIIQYAIVKEVR